MAAWNGHYLTLETFLNNAANPNARDHEGQTALHKAAAQGRQDIVTYLTQKGADLHICDNASQIPVDLAMPSGHDALKWPMLHNWVGELDSDDYRPLPLHQAVWYGINDEVVQIFDEGHDINEVDSWVRPALFDIDVNSKTNGGTTPLLNAAANGHKGVVQLLLAKSGINQDLKDKQGGTPLAWAAENGHEVVMELLLARDDVSLGSKEATKQESWMKYPNFNIVIALLLAKRCVDVNSKDTNGRTPLSWAAGEGHYERVKLLLAEDSINWNIKDNDGHTALWRAEKNGHEDVSKTRPRVT